MCVYMCGRVDKDVQESICFQLQCLFASMQLSVSHDSLETKGLTNSFGWSGSEAFEQHDVQVCVCVRVYIYICICTSVCVCVCIYA